MFSCGLFVGAEMKSFAENSSSKYEVESDAASDQSPSPNYVVIGKSGGQPNGRLVQREAESGDDDSSCISPTSTSMSTSSEADSTASYKSPAMVCKYSLMIVINY
jgi:hypothetical protein